MSNIISTVTQILEMDKEIEGLRLENSLLKEEMKQRTKKPCDCNPKENSTLDKLAIKFGKKKLYESVFYYGERSITAKRNGEEIIYTNFDEWAISWVKYNNERVPLEASAKEIVEYFKDELMEIYKAKCESAYKILIREEQELKEDEE